MVYKIIYATRYMQQVDNALQVGTKLEFNIELRLSVIKPLNAKWLVEYYNHISSETGTEVIVNEFKLAGIYDAIRSGKSSLQSIDPFNDITQLADSLSEGNPGNFVQLSNDLRELSDWNWMKINQKMMKILNGALRTISIEMLLTILLLMMNRRTEPYVISVISKFNLLFLVTLVMFKEKNEKKIKFLTYCLDKTIKNLIVCEIEFPRKFL